MASSKASKAPSKKLPKSLRKGALPQAVEDVWAAGVGALADARKKGGESFEALVDLGSSVIDTGSDAARTAVDQVEKAASSLAEAARGATGGAVDHAQGRVEAVVEAVLSRAGVPGRDEVVALREQVEALQARIQALTADGADRAATPAARRSGAAAAPPAAEAVEAAPAVYEVRPHERGWAVQKAGADRATAVHATKKEALRDARQTAKTHAPSRLLVFKADGSAGETIEYEAD